MSIKIIGTTSGVEADVSIDKALFVEVRSPAMGALGAYQTAAVSGDIAATLASGSTLFSFRWTDATRLCLIKYIRVGGIVSGVVTTGVLFDMEAILARSFSGSDTGGTTLSGNKLRTSMGASLSPDVRIATTATLTPGTRTLDSFSIARIQGFTGTTAGTQIFGSGSGPMPLVDRRDAGRYPIVLAQNEGVLIRNTRAGPATGTLAIGVEIEWQEVSSY